MFRWCWQERMAGLWETNAEFSLNSSHNNTRQINPSKRHRYEVSGGLKISNYCSAFQSSLQEQSGHLRPGFRSERNARCCCTLQSSLGMLARAPSHTPSALSRTFPLLSAWLHPSRPEPPPASRNPDDPPPQPNSQSGLLSLPLNPFTIIITAE